MSFGEEQRFRLVLHYDGAGFYGWQVQPERRTVQGVLQDAAERLTGAARAVTGSGRTDRGVHATGQVASLTLPSKWAPDEFRRAMNAVLPADVWVREAEAVDPEFHPVRDAVARTYRYRVGTAPRAWSPFHRPYCWALDEDEALELRLLEAGAARIPGERSFAAFAKAGQPHRGTVCRVTEAGWARWDDVGVALTITSDRYLHHMVRYLVGTMVDVARGRRPLAQLEALLDDPGTGHRTSPPAPPQGLFLRRVEYPQEAPRGDGAPAGPGAAETSSTSPTPTTRES